MRHRVFYGLAVLFLLIAVYVSHHDININPNATYFYNYNFFESPFVFDRGGFSQVTPQVLHAAFSQSGIFIFAYYLLTALLGYLIFSPVLEASGLSLSVRLSASFIPGYFSMIAVNRVFSLILPHRYAPGACWSALVGMVAFGFWKARRRHSHADTRWRNELIGVISCTFGLFFCLIFGLKLSSHFLVGDGIWTFVHYLEKSVANINWNEHMGMIDQQYDEVLFSYPMVYLERLAHFPTALYFWLSRSVAAFTGIACVYAILRVLGVRILLAGAFTLFVFYGTLSLNALCYHDVHSMGPTGQVEHAGRIFGIFLPAFILVFLARIQDHDYWRHRAFAPFALILMGLGIASIGFHSAFFAVTYILAYFYLFERNHPEKVQMAARWKWGLLACALLGLLRTYSYTHKNGKAALPLAFGIAAGFLCLWLVSQTSLARIRQRATQYRLPALAAGSIVFGLLFLGNIPSHMLLTKLPFLKLNWLLSRGLVNEHREFQLFTYETNPAARCISIAHFLIMHATGILAVVWSCALLLKKSSDTSHRPSAQHAGILLQLITLTFSLFASAFFISDFCQLGVHTTLTTRFIEIPMYGLMVLLCLTVAASARKEQEYFLCACLLAWSILPFVNSHRTIQWLENLKFLRQAL